MKYKQLIVLAASIFLLSALGLAEFSYHIQALELLLFGVIVMLSQVEHGGPIAKIKLTATFGIVSFFIYINGFGISADPVHHDILSSLTHLAHAIHLEIFIFLAGLYMVVNTFAYSGIIGDSAWKIVKKARGKLGPIMVSIMVLTSILSGLFDGATIASIMGVVTLTILLASAMQVKHIVQILLLLAVATNIGGVWFVLGEPTNILAAEKLGLSPFFFLKYALPFAVPAVLLCAHQAWKIVQKYPPVAADRPEMEILLEGVSLKRAHYGTGTLFDTLRFLGKVELRHLEKMQEIHEKEGVPDFEAALKAGIPKERVYESLSINLHSEELAAGLIECYSLKEVNDPMAYILIGDLLQYVRNEYNSRLQSRRLVVFSGILLIVFLGFHAVYTQFPTWLGTLIAGVIAIAAVQKNARKLLLSQTWENLMDALFLVAIFAIISEINFTGAFEAIGKGLLHMGPTPVVGTAILTVSALLSSVADNIAVMDVLTNLIVFHDQWHFFALASIVGTALGGFFSPIASVQAVILAAIVQRVWRISFLEWIIITAKWFTVLLISGICILLTVYSLGVLG